MKRRERETGESRSGPARSNADVARALRELALFLEIRDVPFKPRAFEKAAYSVDAAPEPLEAAYRRGGLKALEELPAVGRGIAERIAELFDTGHIAELERERARLPADVLGLTSIEGIGPKTVRALHDELGVRSLADLAKAAASQKIRTLPGFGAKSEANIVKGLEFHDAFSGRHPIGQVLPLAQQIEARLAELPGVERAVVAGSLRRRQETIGDVDLLVASKDPERVMDAFTRWPEVVHVYARGPTKSMVRLQGDIDADLRVVELGAFGAALQYFTGNKAHNVALRRIARKRRLKLSEYGLFRGSRAVAGRTEQSIYEALGLAYIAPELRQDSGEIEAARAGALPELIPPGALRGDLQVHTHWTDGKDSIERMARAAGALGLEYVVVSDHTRDLAMTGGLDAARLREQIREVRDVDRRVRGVRVLAGAEVNVRRDGSLDLGEDALGELDVVGAAVHSYFELPRDETTRRLIRVLENPQVDVLYHPMCRALGRRRALDADWDAVLDAARRTGTVLEIDAQPERLDLPDEWVRKAIHAGVKLVIDSDAHGADELRYSEDFGLAVARRGWARTSDVLNTLHADELLDRLKRSKRFGPLRRQLATSPNQ